MKVKGIKKAVGDYRRWTESNFSYCANIMMDISTGEVWTDCFFNPNEWKVYHSQGIISLSSYFAIYSLSKVTMDEIKCLIVTLMDDGIIPHFEINYRRK